MTADHYRQLVDNKGHGLSDEGVLMLIADLADMEKLAIGGEGETHYYYKDVVEDLRKRLDEAVKALDFAHSDFGLILSAKDRGFGIAYIEGVCGRARCDIDEAISKVRQ